MPRAILSVHDKSGITELAASLVELGLEVVSTGGTQAAITAAGIAVTAVSSVTGLPEMLDGRVKTLHPMIHGGLLGRPELPAHAAEMATHGIEPVRLSALNLYPFEATVGREGVTLDEAVEQIDIGGPAMIRAAAKNFANVVVLTDPADYAAAIVRLQDGSDDLAWRRSLAAKAYQHVSTYDALVAAYLRDEPTSLPLELTVPVRRAAPDLRYGENPHQAAAAYRIVHPGDARFSILDSEQLGGKTLSYNNLLDADAAAAVVRSFAGPAASVIKHTIPCGVATAVDAATAVDGAIAADPVSAFGGIVAVNRPVDAATAASLAGTFFEVILAPSFETEALGTLRRKTQLRLLAHPGLAAVDRTASLDIRSISGGLLIQAADGGGEPPSKWAVVSATPPTDEQVADLAFAWTVVRHAKSNAVALASRGALVGLGCGQPNRVDSVRHAVGRAAGRAVGSVLASDAFFPFADGVQEAIAAGVRAVVQPGGSVRDAEVIAAADAAGIAMVFTGERHFRH